MNIPTNEPAEQPKGSPFIIEQIPFHYGERIDFSNYDLSEDKFLDWPMVYILANSDSAYVGQTTSVVNRMNQHGANEEKKDFDTANIIYNDEFNVSVITDYEHRLIGYMHADGRYTLTNKNDGMEDANYFSKDAYTAMFDELWDDLRDLELADHTIAQIEESEVFKYSPYKKLNADQRVALGNILDAIEGGIDNASPIVVEGMPGTGKTVLAIFLLKMLRDNPKYDGMNIRILEPVTSLRKTLKKSLKGVSGLDPSDIIGPNDLAKEEMGFEQGKGKCFDILLVDEAHKLRRRVNLVATQYGYYDGVSSKLGLPRQSTQLDWVLSQAKLPIFFYDPLQVINPGCIGHVAMEDALGDALRNPIKLESQMRVKGGDAYLTYVRDVLDGKHQNCRSFDTYDIVLHEDFQDFVASFEESYQVHDLTRMVAGYAWKWVSKNDRNASDIVIDGIGLRWNRTFRNWVGLGTEDEEIAHEVGCIHSIQGYDLSYAYVIIGDDLVLDEVTGVPESNRSSYYDRNGYKGASKEDLDFYIRNIYYVLLTRGILGTHVYVKNPVLRDYFAQYFPLAS